MSKARELVKQLARHIATTIADDLFIDGTGRKAERLVIELRGGIEGGGWCHAAVVDRIERVLLSATTAPTEES